MSNFDIIVGSLHENKFSWDVNSNVSCKSAWIFYFNSWNSLVDLLYSLVRVVKISNFQRINFLWLWLYLSFERFSIFFMPSLTNRIIKYWDRNHRGNAGTAYAVVSLQMRNKTCLRRFLFSCEMHITAGITSSALGIGMFSTLNFVLGFEWSCHVCSCCFGVVCDAQKHALELKKIANMP